VKSVIGPISENDGQVLVMLVVLDVTQLVVDRVQVLEVVRPCAHPDSIILKNINRFKSMNHPSIFPFNIVQEYVVL
jgi:hypothetical protein